VLIAVRPTFITPFDRRDLVDLIWSMDDAIDQMQQTAKAILLFDVCTSNRKCENWRMRYCSAHSW
jgi:uncharacterized protein